MLPAGGVTAPALRGLSRFADARGIPASREFLLDYDVIEAFCVAGLAGRAPATRGTYRSALYRLAVAANGRPGCRPTPFPGARALTAAPGSPFKAEGLGPFGSEFRPTDPGQLFVSSAHNTAVNSGTVSAFTDFADGTLSPIAGSPFADGQMAPCWVEITHDGQFLFTVNTASGTISRYRIAHDGALMLLGSTPVGQTGGVGAVDARLSPDGGFLYVDESRIGKVGAFAVHGGNLTELSSSPTSLPAGATPAGIVVN